MIIKLSINDLIIQKKCMSIENVAMPSQLVMVRLIRI